MAKKPTCYDCAYSYFDRGQWIATIGMGWSGAPVCANQPDSYGQTLPVPRGGVCCNYRARTASPKGHVKQISVGHGLCAYVDAADYEWLSRWTWGLHNGYAGRYENKKLIFMHRAIMQPPEGKVVDHRNHNKLDNTRANLHVCTQPENIRNASKRNGTSSRFVGVYYHRLARKWCAVFWFKGKCIYLGLFTDEEEAARAYDRKAVEMLGEVARPNFPEEWPARKRRRVHAAKARAAGRKPGGNSRKSKRS